MAMDGATAGGAQTGAGSDEFDDIAKRMSVMNRKAKNAAYRLLRPRKARFHRGQKRRLLGLPPKPKSAPTEKPSSPPAVLTTDDVETSGRGRRGRQSRTGSVESQASGSRRQSRHNSISGSGKRHSKTGLAIGIMSNKAQKALKAMQKVPVALKHIQALIPMNGNDTADMTLEQRLDEFNNRGSKIIARPEEPGLDGPPPEAVFLELFGLAPKAAGQAASPAPNPHEDVPHASKPVAKRSCLEPSMETFIEHGLLPEPVKCDLHFKGSYAAFDMKNMDQTQRDLYTFAREIERKNRNNAKSMQSERAKAYRRAQWYHQELLAAYTTSRAKLLKQLAPVRPKSATRPAPEQAQQQQQPPPPQTPSNGTKGP